VIQTVLKLTLPGVPVIYQGTELWDLSMVDPDNRRPVDYELRMGLLSQVLRELDRDRRKAMHEYAEAWRDGRFKLAATAVLLAHRRSHPDLFARGTYQALDTQGNDADRICAFLRSDDDDVLLVAVARFPSRGAKTGRPAGDAIILLPETLARFRWCDLISGQEYASGSALAAPELFAAYPAAVLVPIIGR
jgi:(1->4)-alpha-D-glucan 1-alpha-D-glucosylmutase